MRSNINFLWDQYLSNFNLTLFTEFFGHLPICVAKTQYSFSTNPDLKGALSNHELAIRKVRLSAGAGFIVVVGAILTMPSLPRVPAANSIRLNNAGEIEGLF